MSNYDVIVSGGGIAGCACAYMSAKLGQKTLLVERATFLGGLITGGLVIPSMKTNQQGLNTEFYDDLIEGCKKFNAHITYGDGNPAWFNPELLKIVLEDMLLKVGCKILLEAKVKGVKKNILDDFEGKIFSKTLSIPFVTKYMVDATGDGSLSKLLNCEFWQDTLQKQPHSLRFMVSDVDITTFCKFLEKTDRDRSVTNFFEIDGSMHFTTAYTFDKSKKWALEPYFIHGVENGTLEYADTDYFQIFSVAAMPNTVAFNCPRLKEDEKKREFSYSYSIIEARKAIYRIHKFCKAEFKGFENSFISNIADMVGVRESGRVKCKYDFTIDDIISPKSFNNPVLYTDYPIDIHSNKKDDSVLEQVLTYSLPLESLMARDCEGLFVIGRCLGADFKAQASLRVQISCMSMGEGVSRYIATSK